MEVDGQLHAPAALTPGKKSLVTIVSEASWFKSEMGLGKDHQNEI
jgi:hypothetical protein